MLRRRQALEDPLKPFACHLLSLLLRHAGLLCAIEHVLEGVGVSNGLALCKAMMSVIDRFAGSEKGTGW